MCPYTRVCVAPARRLVERSVFKTMLGREGRRTPLVHSPRPQPWLGGPRCLRGSVPSVSLAGTVLHGEGRLWRPAGRVGPHGDVRDVRPGLRPAPRHADRLGETVHLRPCTSGLPSAFSSPFSCPGANTSHVTSSPGRTHRPRPLRRPGLVTWLQVSSSDCSGKHITVFSPCPVP